MVWSGPKSVRSSWSVGFRPDCGNTNSDTISLDGDYCSLFGDGQEPGSASGIYDLIQDDDGYVPSDSLWSHTNDQAFLVSHLTMTRTASISDSVLLSKYLSPCPSSHCIVCKGSGSNLVNPEWMLDSGTSAHFTPVFSNFITFIKFKEPVRVNTTASPLKQLGFGMVLLHTSVKNKRDERSQRHSVSEMSALCHT